MAVVKGIPYNCEGNAPECIVFVPGLVGILAEYLVFDPDPAAGWLRGGEVSPRPPPSKKQIFQIFQIIQPIQPVEMIGPIQPLQPVELVQ